MVELLLQTAPASAGRLLLWTFLGLAGGLVAGLALAFLLRRVGAFRLEWEHARWLRLLAALWILAAAVAAGGVVGGCEGTLRGAERAVADTAVRGGPLLHAASCVSAGVAWLDLQLQGAHEQALDEFLQGKRTLDVPGFYARLAQAEAAVVDKLVAAWNVQAQARLGLASTPLVDSLLGGSLRFVAQRVVRKTIDEKTKGLGPAKDGFFAALEEAPASHRELAARLVDRCLVPLTLLPVRYVVRGQQTAALLLGAGALLLPVLAFWIGRLLERRRASPAGPPPPASP